MQNGEGRKEEKQKPTDASQEVLTGGAQAGDDGQTDQS